MMLCSTNTFSGGTYVSGMKIKIPVLYNSSQVTRDSVIKKKKNVTKKKSKKSFPGTFVKKK